ncbi:endospore germination permease [Ureibacillus composti]|nr:endospore germination permease [Ureibacillus composti]
MQNVKISSGQFLVLVTLFSVGTSVLIVPSALAAQAKQDAWVVAIVSTVIGLFIIWLFCLLAQWFPQFTFVQMNEKILGKWLGKVASLLFVLMCLLYASTLLYYSGTFLNTHIMPNTPMAALSILMMLVIVMGVRLGLETIARSAELLIFWFFILFILLLIFISPEVKVENIQPILESSPKTILQTSITLLEVTSINAIVLLMIFPAFINNIKQAKKAFFIGNLLSGFIIIILTFYCVSVLGVYSTASELYPGYELAQRINIGDFIQRIEAFMAAQWIIALYFKTTIYFYGAVYGFAQIMNLKDYRPLTTPFGIIVVVLSLIIYPNVVYLQEWIATTGLLFSYSIGLFLPLLLIVVYVIRKKLMKQI